MHMSKRFTETAKWADPWFRALTAKQKCLWLWLCDNCDCAGVVPEVDWGLVSFQIGEPCTADDLASFGDRIASCERGFWIRKFVAFQWGYISADHPSMPQRGVIKALERAGIPLEKAIESLSKGFPKGLETLKDKDKDKDKDKKEDRVQGKEGDALKADACAPTTDSEWLAGLKVDPAWTGIDIHREFARMRAWCDENRKQPTRRRFLNWLLRCDRPISATSTPVKAYL